MDKSSSARLLGTANLIMVTMLISRVLGFVRDIIIYAQFGQNRITDAYNAAFSIPDFLYMLLVGGALSSAFIPVFSAYIARDRKDEGWRVVSIIFNWIMLLLAIGVTLGIAFAPHLINLLVPGFNAATLKLTVALTRIMFIQVIFMCLSGISMGILNSHKHFTSPAIGSVLYNLGIIAGGLLLAPPIERFFPGYGIAGFSIGVVLGAVMNLAVQIPALMRLGMTYSFSFDLRNPGVKQLITLIIPVFIGLAASQFNLFVNQNLASSLPSGMVAALRTAQRLMQVPISVFGISIAMAFFPMMSAYAARDEWQNFKESTMSSLRAVMFITLPTVFGLIALREPLIRLMFQFQDGKFTAEATSATAYALLFYSFGIFAYAGIHVLSRAFYSMQDTRTPVLAAVASIVVNIALSLYLVRVMNQGGLALAYSLAGIYNLLVLILLFGRKVGHWGARKLFSHMLIMTLISLVMALVVYMFMSVTDVYMPFSGKLWQLAQLSIAIILGAGIYWFVSQSLHIPEASVVLNILRRRLRRS